MMSPSQCVIAVGLIFSSSAAAVTVECVGVSKTGSNHAYTAEEIAKEKPSVIIEDEAAAVAVSRCSYSKLAAKVTCDRYVIDKVEKYLFPAPLENGQPRVLKKYYLFSAQYDLQVFPDLSFVENNGRGTITFGTCRLLSP
jgi:hypothetical protein